jgi:hypothetical protein
MWRIPPYARMHACVHVCNAYACMHVCMCVMLMYACMWKLCVHVCMCIWTHACGNFENSIVYMHAFVHACDAYACMHAEALRTPISIHAFRCACVYHALHACMWRIGSYACMHTHEFCPRSSMLWHGMMPLQTQHIHTYIHNARSLVTSVTCLIATSSSFFFPLQFGVFQYAMDCHEEGFDLLASSSFVLFHILA